VNLAVFRHTARQNRFRIVVIAAALVGWGVLMPVIYATFGVTLRDIIEQFPLVEQFANFGGGSVFTLSGSIALGFIHPIAIALLAVFAIALPLGSISGERQRGTLENVLARPVSRRSLYVTLLVAATIFIAVGVAAILVGTLAASAAMDVLDELQLANIPVLWLNGVLLYVAIAALAFAASVSFDRVAPAASIVLAVVIVAYFLQVIGSLWPDAEWLQPYSIFYYLKADDTLETGLQPFDVGLLLAIIVIFIAYALWVFPRRDLAAPA
jgi:ABC-2 type transport system permease protein